MRRMVASYTLVKYLAHNNLFGKKASDILSKMSKSNMLDIILMAEELYYQTEIQYYFNNLIYHKILLPYDFIIDRKADLLSELNRCKDSARFVNLLIVNIKTLQELYELFSLDEVGYYIPKETLNRIADVIFILEDYKDKYNLPECIELKECMEALKVYELKTYNAYANRDYLALYKNDTISCESRFRKHIIMDMIDTYTKLTDRFAIEDFIFNKNSNKSNKEVKLTQHFSSYNKLYYNSDDEICMSLDDFLATTLPVDINEYTLAE